MASAQTDTEITLGTGRMLAIFFGLVLLCAFFFALGFSLGRHATALAGPLPSGAPVTTATAQRPSAAKDEAPASPPTRDFSFYKAVGEKKADSALTPEPKDSAPPLNQAPKAATDAPSAAALATGAGYFVQVAAVSRQEDAQALVEALKKKQYPAFSANNAATDKFFHVQVGPYADLKEAEAMRLRLIGDGYNPIVKK